MRIALALVLLAIAQPALAWESMTVHVGLSGSIAKGHRPHLGVEVGGSYAFGLQTVSPSLGVRARMLFDDRGPVLPQLVAAGGVTAGPLTPLLSAQAEVGLVVVRRQAVPAFGLSAWTAPIEIVSPRLGVAWTHFRDGDAPQDLFQASVGAALVAPTYVLIVDSPPCIEECD